MRYTAEAEKLKWTYLAALENCLSDMPPRERVEMVEGIRDHLDESVAELKHSVVDGHIMKSLIDRIGDVDVLSKLVDGKSKTGEKTIKILEREVKYKDEGSMAFTAQWQGVSHGYTIRVTSKWNLLLFGWEYLYVDDHLVDKSKGWMNTSCTLSGTVTKEGEPKLSVRTHLGNESIFTGIICKVWVNDSPIPLRLMKG